MLALLSALLLSATPRPVAVVELFTSEGCSSCPPADATLAALAAEPGTLVVPLALHVDYWDDNGWRDPFSSRAWTQRQAGYGRDFYTPMMVVNGGAPFVGSDRARARAQIAASTVAPLAVSVARTGDRLTVTVDPVDGASTFIAITEDDLLSVPDRGENMTRRLTHMGVVRWLGRAAPGLSIDLERAWKADALHVVAFAQRAGQGAIVAAGTVPVPRAAAH